MSATMLTTIVVYAVLFILIFLFKDKIKTKTTLASVTIGAILVIIGISTLVSPATTLETLGLTESVSQFGCYGSHVISTWCREWGEVKICGCDIAKISLGATRGIAAGVLVTGGGLMFWSWKRMSKGS